MLQCVYKGLYLSISSRLTVSPCCFLFLDHLFCFLIPSCKETKTFPHFIFKTCRSIPDFTDFVTQFYLPLEASITFAVLDLYKQAHHKG